VSDQQSPFDGIEITTKTFLQSSTIRYLMTVVVTNLAALGLNMSWFTDKKTDAIINLFALTVSVVGGLLAMRARRRSTEIITPKSVPNQVLGTVRAPTNPAEGFIPTNVYRDLPSGSSNNLAVLLGLLTLFAINAMGCQQYSTAEHVNFRETMWKGMDRTAVEHNGWAKILAGDTNQDGIVDQTDTGVDLTKLPKLDVLTMEQRNAWLQARLLPYREASKWVEQDRVAAPVPFK
jgi:hypothetical protein